MKCEPHDPESDAAPRDDGAGNLLGLAIIHHLY